MYVNALNLMYFAVLGETEGELTRKADELASIAETDSKIQNAPKSGN